MKKIDTKHNIVHFYEDVMSKEECNAVYDFVLNLKKDNIYNNSNKMPWETSDTINKRCKYKKHYNKKCKNFN